MSVRVDGPWPRVKALDDVSAYEHSLYEVRRDLKALRKADGRAEFTTGEQALIDAPTFTFTSTLAR